MTTTTATRLAVDSVGIPMSVRTALLSISVQGRTCGDLVVGTAGDTDRHANDLAGIGWLDTVSE